MFRMIRCIFLLLVTLLMLSACKVPVGGTNTPPNPIISVTPDTFDHFDATPQPGTFNYQNGVADPDGDSVTVEIIAVEFDQAIDEAEFINAFIVLDENTFQIEGPPTGVGDYLATLTIRVSDGIDTTESTLANPLTMQTE